jgi:hypothetical protein
MPDLPTGRRRAPLKMEPVTSDDNFEEQLLTSLRRINDGLSGIHELVTGVISKVEQMEARAAAEGRK